jgi:hypothetical protein
MSQEIESQATANIKDADHFAIQMNMSTDITEQFLLYKPLPETKKAMTFLMLIVISVLMICHGNPSASAWAVLPLCLEA